MPPSTRKSPANRTRAKLTPATAKSNVITMEDLDREVARRGDKDPFTFQLPDGYELRFSDPDDVDWQELNNILLDGTDEELLRLILSEEDVEAFFAIKPFSNGRLKALARMWMEYYAVTADSRGNTRASRR